MIKKIIIIHYCRDTINVVIEKKLNVNFFFLVYQMLTNIKLFKCQMGYLLKVPFKTTAFLDWILICYAIYFAKPIPHLYDCS